MTFWERHPGAFEGISDIPPIAPNSLFRTVVTAYENQNLRGTVGVLAYMNGEQQHGASAERLFPRLSDGSFENHSKRLKTTIGDCDFCFLVNHLEFLDESLWRWSRDFLSGLFQNVGMNSLGVFYALFFGTYRTTPFGVHRDPESVFHLPVIGTKQMRIWPIDAIDPNSPIVHSMDYRHSLDRSVLLQANPGGFIYWPSRHWHTGEGAGELTVSLALSLFCFDSLEVALATQLVKSLVAEHGDLKQPVRKHHRIPFDPTNLQRTSENLPDHLHQAAEELRQHVSDEALIVGWLRLCSASGFLTPPQQRRHEQIRPQDKVSVVPGDAALYRVLRPGLTAVAVNGHVTMTSCPGVGDMVQLLCSNSTHSVQSLLDALSSSDKSPTMLQDALNVICHLIRSRALNRISDSAD